MLAITKDDIAEKSSDDRSSNVSIHKLKSTIFPNDNQVSRNSSSFAGKGDKVQESSVVVSVEDGLHIATKSFERKAEKPEAGGLTAESKKGI